MKIDMAEMPRRCQDAMIDMLKELFKGKKYSGQQSRKELCFFKQDLPVPEDNDADVDTDAAPAPYIVVQMSGGEVKSDDKTQNIDLAIVICVYSEDIDRSGYQQVTEIKEDIVQKLCMEPYFGGAFTVLKPVVWAMQEDDTHPYYYAAVTLSVTAPAMTQDDALKELL